MPDLKNPAQLDSSVVYQCLAACSAAAGAAFLTLRANAPQALYGGAFPGGAPVPRWPPPR